MVSQSRLVSRIDYFYLIKWLQDIFFKLEIFHLHVYINLSFKAKIYYTQLFDIVK